MPSKQLENCFGTEEDAEGRRYGETVATPRRRGGNGRQLQPQQSPTKRSSRISKRRGSISGEEIIARMQARRSLSGDGLGGSSHHTHQLNGRRRQSISANQHVASPVKSSTRTSKNLSKREFSTADHTSNNVVDRHKSLPGAASELVRGTYQKLKKNVADMQSQIAALQREVDAAQNEMEFLNDLASMNDEERINCLFDTLDEDRGGLIDAEELAAAMEQNKSGIMSTSESLTKAIDLVAKFDADGNGELDREEFHNFVESMAPNLDMTASDFCESLLVQLSSAATRKDRDSTKIGQQNNNDDDERKTKLKKRVQKRVEVLDFLSEKGMSHSFVLRDL